MAQFYTSLLIVTILVVLCDSATMNFNQDSKCGSNAVYLKCGNSCIPYVCNQTNEESGSCGRCVEGCFCMPGYIKLTPEMLECVPLKMCDTVPIPKCKKYERYINECQWDCVKTCENLRDPKCDRWCIKGCLCEPGYVRTLNSHDSPCILPTQCPK
ncbi:von Willebrand factor-like [Onthophagus taurus]|uniref:von Willebrand factor-like n=1 Tax=Onthophagus taurus TaxID=166361 RepID=UPI000C207939|nr:von Willebrand factor-like [Onthophagus taurus]